MAKTIINFEQELTMINLNDVSSIKHNETEKGYHFITFFIKGSGYISVRFNTLDEVNNAYKIIKAKMYEIHNVISF